MSESLGTAVITLAVDTSNFDAQVARSKNSAAGLGADAEVAFEKVSGNAKRAASSLAKYVDSLGVATEQQRLNNAAVAGVPLTILDAAAAKINAYGQSLATAAAEAKRLQQAAEFSALVDEARKMDFLRTRAQELAAELSRVAQAQRDVAARTDFVANLQQQAQAIGKTRSELLELKAAELGVSQAAAPFIAQLKAQESALGTATKQFNQYGLSTKQTAAALRQVPAQLTDIVVSLQGGQKPLTVLLQQGGQLKDVFGGVVPAAKALGGALLNLINPYTVLAAVVAGVAYAFYDGSQQSIAFDKALALSGNRANQTTDDLFRLSESVATTLGATTSEAAAAVAIVVGTGKIAKENMELVVTAAVEMNRATGKEIGETVQQFAEIGKEPVKAILKLNEAQNFLTASTYLQIRSLEDQGRTQEAAALGTKLYADATDAAATRIVARLGTVERIWQAIKDVGNDAKDAIAEIGRDQTDVARQAELLQAQRYYGAKRDKLSPESESFKYLTGQMLKNADELKQITIRLGIDQAKTERDTQKKVAASLFVELDQGAIQYRTNTEKRAIDRAKVIELAGKAEAAAVASGNKALVAEIAERKRISLAGIDKKYEDKTKTTKGDGGIGNASVKAAGQAFKDSLLEQQGLIANDTKILQAEYADKTISAETYYNRLAELTDRSTKAQEAAILGQINALRVSSAVGKDSINNAREIATLEAQLAKVRADGATQQIINGKQLAAINKANAQAVTDYKNALDLGNAALQANVDATIAKLTMGQREFEQQSALNELYRKSAIAIAELNRQKNLAGADTSVLDAKIQAEKDNVDKQVAIAKDGFARLDAAQADWLTGASVGVKNWMDETSKVSEQIAVIAGGILDKSADAIANWAETGKIQVKSLLIDILKQILAFMAKQAVLNFVKALAGNAKPGSFLASLGGAATAALTGEGPAAGGAGVVNAGFGVPKSLPASATAPQVSMQKSAVSTTNSPSVNISISMAGGNSTTSTSSDGEKGQQLDQFAKQMAAVAQEQIQKATMPGGTLFKIGVNA